MPKKCNTKKSASAQFQCLKAIKSAAEGSGGLVFASVQSAKGNGYFTLRLAEGKEARGTPRGLFTSGSMRISVGQIVVASGSQKNGMEIVGVIQDRATAEELVASGAMPAEILGGAYSAGGILETVEDDLFEASEEVAEAPEVRGGVKGQRAFADARRSIAARLESLINKTATVVPQNSLEEVDIDAI